MTRIAVIVTTYNRSDALAAVLTALRKQVRPHDEVIVADDGSSREHVQAIVQRHWGWPCVAKHTWHPDVGFTVSSARNMAVLQSTAPYLVFLDGDCVPQSDFLDQHRALASQGCFVNGSRVLLSEQLTQQSLSQGWDLSTWGAWDWLRAWVRSDANKWTHLLRWPHVWRKHEPRFVWRGIRACNLAIWRSDFEAVDGFDEAFNGWGHEDADIVLRLHALGCKRINGYAATEVFHLWHRQNPRADEQINRQRVLERERTGQVRSDIGLHARQEQVSNSVGSVTECSLLS